MLRAPGPLPSPPPRAAVLRCRTDWLYRFVPQAEESGQLELSGLVRAAVHFRLEHKLLHLEVIKVCVCVYVGGGTGLDSGQCVSA